MQTDNELFSVKEKVLYAKVNYKNKYPNLNISTPETILKRKNINLLSKEIKAHSMEFINFESRLELAKSCVNTKPVKSKNTNLFLSTRKTKPKMGNLPLLDEEMRRPVFSTATVLKYKFKKDVPSINPNVNNNNAYITHESTNTSIFNGNENEFPNLKVINSTHNNYFKGNTFYNKVNTNNLIKNNIKNSSLIDAFSLNTKIANNSLDLVKYVKTIRQTEIERKKHLLMLKLDILNDNQMTDNKPLHNHCIEINEGCEKHMSVSVINEGEMSQQKQSDLADLAANNSLHIEPTDAARKLLTVEVKVSSVKEENIQLYLGVMSKIKVFLKDKIDFILKEVCNKDIFTAGYFYYMDFSEAIIKSFQREFLLYSYLCEKASLKSSFSKLKFRDDYLEMNELKEYLTEIESNIDRVLENHLEFTNYFKSKESSSLFIIDNFFFRNFVFTRKIHLKRIEYINVFLKALNIDFRVNFDDFIEYKSLLENPKLEFKKKITFIKKVLSIQSFYIASDKMINFNRVFGIEERIYVILKNNDLVDIQNISKEKQLKIERIYVNFTEYLTK